MASVMEMVRADRQREEYAIARGLHKDATWSTIFNHDGEARRQRQILRYGLPASATFHDIFDHEEKVRRDAEEQRQNEKRKGDARELGLPETATEDEISIVREALPIGLFERNYPVDYRGEIETDDSDLG